MLFRSEAADPSRTAEARFMRFFQSTPMAIATVDKAGRIARKNSLFARLFEAAPQAQQAAGEEKKGDDRSILTAVAERDRERRVGHGRDHDGRDGKPH